MSSQNLQLINLVQAMLGSISGNFRAVFLDCQERRAMITFVLERDTAEDREEIEDILFEFEALQETGVEIDKNIIIGLQPIGELKNAGHLVFSRKEEN
jgi:hypothetical protein